MRAMALGGMSLVDLDNQVRKDRGLSGEAMALYVKGLGQYGKHAAAKKAGFIKEDLIVSIDGLSTRTTEGELIGRLLQSRKAGELVDVTVMRGSERVALKLPMQ